MIAAHVVNIHFLNQDNPLLYRVASEPRRFRCGPGPSTLLLQQRETIDQRPFCGELATMLEPSCITDPLATRKL